MSTREHLVLLHSKALDFWLARASVALIAMLQMLLINHLSIGPRWLAPAIELALVLPLSLATAWQQHHASRASTASHWEFIARHRRPIRRAAVLLTAIISVMNFGALWQLVQALLHGGGQAGSALLVDALNVWMINTITFALWYWEIDRGGPSVRTIAGAHGGDFLFPQATVASADDPPFVPGFVDYLFVAFTNATAFSPTDTLPISHRAKLLMMAQALASLITVALVTARAVNILN